MFSGIIGCMASPRLLLIEDDPETQVLVSRVIAKEFPSTELFLAHSGRDALTLLEVDGPSLGVDLVLLDLNIPLPSGQDVLARLRGREQTKHLPVVVFSGSQNPKDREFCRKHGAAFVAKPDDYPGYVEVLRHTLTFWLETVQW